METFNDADEEASRQAHLGSYRNKSSPSPSLTSWCGSAILDAVLTQSLLLSKILDYSSGESQSPDS